MGRFLNFIGLEETDENEALRDDDQQPVETKREPRSRRRENALWAAARRSLFRQIWLP